MKNLCLLLLIFSSCARLLHQSDNRYSWKITAFSNSYPRTERNRVCLGFNGIHCFAKFSGTGLESSIQIDTSKKIIYLNNAPLLIDNQGIFYGDGKRVESYKIIEEHPGSIIEPKVKTYKLFTCLDRINDTCQIRIVTTKTSRNRILYSAFIEYESIDQAVGYFLD